VRSLTAKIGLCFALITHHEKYVLSGICSPLSTVSPNMSICKLRN